MSTGYGWEGLRQVCPTLLGECGVGLCGGIVYLGALQQMFSFTFFYILTAQIW